MTVRLARIAVESWPTVDGHAVAHGVPDLLDMPLDRFLNFVWHLLTRESSAPDIERLRGRLWRPPVGEAVTDTRSPWSPQNEQKGFASLKAGLGMGGAKS